MVKGVFSVKLITTNMKPHPKTHCRRTQHDYKVEGTSRADALRGARSLYQVKISFYEPTTEQA